VSNPGPFSSAGRFLTAARPVLNAENKKMKKLTAAIYFIDGVFYCKIKGRNVHFFK
jgi:hypothetical protein